MKVRHFQITRDSDKQRCAGAIVRLSLDKPKLVEIKPLQSLRSLQQNRLSFLWYRELARYFHDDPQSMRRYCKLTFGVPILVDDDAEFAAFWSAFEARFSYEDQTRAMGFVDVTRLFTVRQFAEYLNDIEHFFGREGVPLPHPDDLYHAALMRDAA